MKKLIYLFGVIGWSVICGMTIVGIIQGWSYRPMAVLLPSLGCLLHFIEKLIMTCIQEDEELIKEIVND